MKVKGIHTETYEVDVLVNPREILQKLYKEWVTASVGKNWWYINREGYWEEWEDTHGSGITEVHREATEQEKETNKAFEVLLGIVDHKGVKV